MITPKSGGIRSKRPKRERRNVPLPASPRSIPASIHKNLRKASREWARWRNSRMPRVAQIAGAIAGRVTVENHNGVGWPENTTAQYIQAEPKTAQTGRFGLRLCAGRRCQCEIRRRRSSLGPLLKPSCSDASVARQGMLQAVLAFPSLLLTRGLAMRSVHPGHTPCSALTLSLCPRRCALCPLRPLCLNLFTHKWNRARSSFSA
jgi:hypothetical protein